MYGTTLVADVGRNGLKWKPYWKSVELPEVAANLILVASRGKASRGAI